MLMFFNNSDDLRKDTIVFLHLHNHVMTMNIEIVQLYIDYVLLSL